MGDAPYDDPTWTIWACQAALSYPACKRVDRVFELHTEAYWRNPEILQRMVTANVPVMMQRIFPEVPLSEEYPLKPMMMHFESLGYAGAKFFNSTIGYMLAYAMFIGGVDEIRLDGVHMNAKEEYERQAPAVAYWVGIANAHGIPVRIPPASGVCKSRYLYGYDEGSGVATEIRIMQTKVRKAMAEAKARVDADVQTLYEHSGADKMLEALFKEFS